MFLFISLYGRRDNEEYKKHIVKCLRNNTEHVLALDVCSVNCCIVAYPDELD